MPEPGEDRCPEGLARAMILAVLVGIGIVVGLIIAYQALLVLEVVAVGTLLALVLRTIARGLERLGLSPFLSSVVLLAVLAALGVLVYFVIVPNVAREARVLISQGPGSLNAVANVLQALPIGPDPSEIVEELENYLSGLFRSLPSLALAFVEEIVMIVSVVFVALYLAVSPDTYIRGLLRLVPVNRRESAREFLDVLAQRLRGWVVGTAIVASFVGVMGGMGLWLLGVPLALTFGILAGILDIIPYVGSIVGGALPALVALTISPITALQVVALFVIINQIEGNLLQPKILGSQVHVPPALILVSILLLATLVGPIVGTLLAVPAAVVVITLLERLTEEEQKESPSEEDEIEDEP